MSTELQHGNSECVVVMAPTGRDAEATRRVFDSAGIECAVESDCAVVADLIRRGIGALVLTDLALADRRPTEIFEALSQQPSWSDVAVLALCRQVEQAPAMARILERF